MMDGISLDHIRTQKAAGYYMLERGNWNTPPWTLVQSLGNVSVVFERFKRHLHGEPIFARGCPKKPWHGFADSKIVKSADEATALYEYCLSLDSEAELMLCKALDAEFSSVWRPGRMAFGAGNDAATAGNGSFSCGLATFPKLHPSVRNLLDMARVSADEFPYLEVVYTGLGETDCHYVQLRGGPQVSGSSPDYIPRNTTVTRILECGDSSEQSLVAFKSLCESCKGVPGVVIDHFSTGGNLASHYSAHGVTNGIPVICTHPVAIGDVLHDNSHTVVPIDPYSVRAGIAAGSLLRLSNDVARMATHMVLTGCHNFTGMQGDDGFFLGLATILMIRLGIAASQGEARYARRGPKDRSLIWQNAFNTSVFKSRDDVPNVLNLFLNHSWSSGYGGAAWANCMSAVKQLDFNTQAVMREPNAEHVKQLGLALHEAVNQAHNNGWWLNKFTSGNAFNDAAAGNPQIFLSAVPMMAAARSIPREDLAEVIVKWKRSADIPDVTKKARRRSKKTKETIKVDTTPVAKAKPTDIVEAQGKLKNGVLHVQFTHNLHPTPEKAYSTFDITPKEDVVRAIQEMAANGNVVTSMAGSSTLYVPLCLSLATEQGKFICSIKDRHVATISIHDHAIIVNGDSAESQTVEFC